MGDFSSPKRRDVVERLRRRFDIYRRHQNKSATRYDNTINSLYERERQETLLLRERWLQSKAKKASKTKKDSSGEHRNLGLTKLLKKKIDSSQSESQNLDTSAFDFDESDTITTQKTVKGGSGVDVSVRIVQEITGGNSQQVQTNVAVSTTVKTHIESKDKPSTSVETSTKFECKQEPCDDIPGIHSNKSDISHTGSEILDQEELEEILKTIEKDESKLSDEIFEELQKFDQIYSKVSQEDSNDSSMFGSMTGSSPGLHKQPPYDPGSAGNSGNMFESPPSNPVRTPPVPFRQPGAITTMTETGPAAETLKQMAAQHQSNQHHGGSQYKQFNTHIQEGNYTNQYPPAMDTSYGYSNQQNINNMRNGNVVYQEGNRDMYAGTKPLTHYPGVAGNPTPSSLQQLQNQVQSFSQSPQMEITQTQQMHVSDGSRRLQMSQTQQMHMRQPPQNISMSQHQSFSMPNNMAQRQSPGYMNEQMKMQQMYQEKMRQEQRHQSMQAAHMQQFMRPPPEYKQSEGYSASRQNPLQTMQDMVEQTNTMQTSGYGSVKTENTPHIQNGMMQSAQMAAMQRGPSSSTINTGPVISQNDAGYHMPQIQRQQSYPGGIDSSLVRQNRQNGHGYTSAIMRNQRPPNVNVGPDGLNISQPRTQEWPRHMMHGTMNGMARPQNPNVMYNNTYAGQAGTTVTNVNQTRPMQMTALQSQAMMQNNAQAQHMMMQQQGMQMSQRMAMANQNNSSFNQRPPQQDDFMNILDSASQSGNSDYIDNMAAQSTGVSSDAAWLDEILSGNRDL
ncbi:MAML [Mytilus edulis]|uniref:Mastermind n=2 Tax=Mytilus TaxID=6548 RepID=A0A8B6EZU4_MYTGA|nr:MAML [Mytilus edulis]VDI42500.1 mastermind [Mytilus galloprovincialis]